MAHATRVAQTTRVARVKMKDKVSHQYSRRYPPYKQYLTLPYCISESGSDDPTVQSHS